MALALPSLLGRPGIYHSVHSKGTSTVLNSCQADDAMLFPVLGIVSEPRGLGLDNVATLQMGYATWPEMCGLAH